MGRVIMSRDLGRKMPVDPTRTEDSRLLEPRARPDFLDTDPWRALRILSEFVEGFAAGDDRGPGISVCGSARVEEGNPAYEIARESGKLRAEEGYAVSAGGGPGVMEAANRGCQGGGGRSVRCDIGRPHE